MWWGWVSLLGVWWGCWWGVSTLSVRLLATAAMSVLSLSWLTASNCGKGLLKVLQQLRQRFRRWLSVFGGACDGGGVPSRVPVLGSVAVPGSGAWLGGCLGSVAVRPAVPARRLPFLPVVLCKGCPCGPVGVPVSVAAFGRGVFRCGGSARIGWCLSVWGLGSARCVAVRRWLVLVRAAPFPLFLGSSPLLFFFPLKPLLFYYLSIS